MSDYAIIHSKILDWEYWDDPIAVKLLLFLILKAKKRPTSYKAESIRRGDVVCPSGYLTKMTGIKPDTVRMLITSWADSGQVVVSKRRGSDGTNFNVIHIVKYAEYQSVETPKSSPQSKPTGPKKVFYSDEFEKFWKAYPNQTGKGDASRAFDRIVERPPVERLLEAVKIQKAGDWTRDNGKYIPHPSTWLNQRRWEDGEVVAKIDEKERGKAKKVEVTDKMKDALKPVEALRKAYLKKEITIQDLMDGAAEMIPEIDAAVDYAGWKGRQDALDALWSWAEGKK